MFLFSGSICWDSEVINWPLRYISPFEIFCNPAIDLKIVVLPTPDGPSKQMISPGLSIFQLKSTT